MQPSAARSLLQLIRCIAAAVATLVVLSPIPAAASPAAQQMPLTWEQWRQLTGVVDIAGPRSDGSLLVMAAGRLYLVSPDGTISPFAAGPDGYSGSPDFEPYFVVAPAPPAAAGCPFPRDEAYILDFASPPGVIRVDVAGRASQLTPIPEADILYGIALDTTGRFGYRLLVSGVRGDRTVVVAVDCQGKRSTITEAAPTIEGGYAVAPPGFGAFGGDLIAADELSGQVWAIGPDGRARLVLTPSLPTGGDTGVESVGFVPPGFLAGGFAYLADRGTPGNPFPGSDSILRLSSEALAAAGVREGDLLVSTEGGGLTVAIRCEATCVSIPVAGGPPGGHIEGRISFTLRQR